MRIERFVCFSRRNLTKGSKNVNRLEEDTESVRVVIETDWARYAKAPIR